MVELLPLQTILQLPIHKLLLGLNTEHWLQHHLTFPANKFLVFDQTRQRLRLRVVSEYPRFPRLCASLYNDILVLRTVRLVPGVWPHIINPPHSSPIDWIKVHFFGYMGFPNNWKEYHPGTNRQEQQAMIQSEHTFSNSMVRTLWSSAAHPSARSVFFRALSRCLRHKSYLRTIGIVQYLTPSVLFARMAVILCDISSLAALSNGHYGNQSCRTITPTTP